jgi:hypothetical protein
MAKLPAPVHATAAAIYRAYEAQAGDGLRPHLGASEIGHDCDRALWYGFRWAERAQFDGRMLRLFETGKREEARVIDNLRAIGCQVWADDGDAQFKVTAVGGHAGGSMDGVVQGLPEAPKTPHLMEVKTHSAKSFKELSAKGVKVAKPQHYAQMQVYCGLATLDRWLYFAVNKDTDELHTERGEFDRAEFDRLMAKAQRIITAAEPPARISDDADWWQCKTCRFAAICHGAAAPLVNCRTCMHSTPALNGEPGGWICEAHKEWLTVDEQRAGCDDHRYIPLTLQRFAEAVDADEVTNAIVYRNTLTGAQFVNADHPGLSSAEIRACADKAMLGQECADATLRALRQEFGATHAAE